jgi:ubiquitin carboxyl-terminal hydrolase 25/28
MQQHPFYLHAILVHSGSADGGHYFAFIYDQLLDKWRRYSDLDVQEVDEETVWSTSLGGENMTSAYCLIYLDQETAFYNDMQFTRDWPLQAEGLVIPNTYTQWIP